MDCVPDIKMCQDGSESDLESGSSTDVSIDLLAPMPLPVSKISGPKTRSKSKEQLLNSKSNIENLTEKRANIRPELNINNKSRADKRKREIESTSSSPRKSVRRQTMELKDEEARSLVSKSDKNKTLNERKYNEMGPEMEKISVKNDKKTVSSNQKEQTIKMQGNFTKVNGNPCTVPEPIIPDFLCLSSSSNPTEKKATGATWVTVNDCVLVRKYERSQQYPRTKAAAFDLDNTLLLWRCSGYPSQPKHYELWNTKVIECLRQLYDEQQYQLIIFSNQGGIKSAMNGKTATRVKGLIDWLSIHLIQRPIFAVLSTRTKSGFHKPSPKIWDICEDICNHGVQFDLQSSFYVGDSDGGGDSGGGGTGESGSNSTNVPIDKYQSMAVDKLFADNVGKKRNTILKFQNPQGYFGPSDLERRQKVTADLAKVANYDAPPKKALQTRAALLSGYLNGPILLLLCGVQGSGKSTFAQMLIRITMGAKHKKMDWVHLSQDTIGKNGKPGKREAVENAAFIALSKGKSVIIDRMNITSDQRMYFIQIAKQTHVPIHVILFQPPSSLIEKRVRERLNHPGGVQGIRGVKLALSSLNHLIMPQYQEDIDLISIISSEVATKHVCESYSLIQPSPSESLKTSLSPPLIQHIPLSGHSTKEDKHIKYKYLPSITLGTQNIGKRISSSVIESAIKKGIQAIDTAPTYNNEEQIGNGLVGTKTNKDDSECYVIVKIPKRATQPSQVRKELLSSIQKLKRDKVDLVLLHWPCDFIEEGTLQDVWIELEKLKLEGYCQSLGVSNFSVEALQVLLPMCQSEKPIVNQVERHPLLPQWDLVDFCMNHNILLQAHTALGHGNPKLLYHELIKEIANENNMTFAQVIMAWNLQQNIPIVVKCQSEEHLQEAVTILNSKNVKVILTSLQMQRLNEMSMNASSQIRFVAPPFMFRNGAIYSWKKKSG